MSQSATLADGSTQPQQAVKQIALVGNPNCGKTSLFNHMTGTRQKVANYAGVTVERKEGRIHLPSGRWLRVLDLPGAYSLEATSPDEEITRKVCLGELAGEAVPDVLVCVVDATNLRLHLRFVLEIRRLGRPMILVLNMMDDARRRGIVIDQAKLSAALGVPVVGTVAVKSHGIDQLLQLLDQPLPSELAPLPATDQDLHQQVRAMLSDTVVMPRMTDRRDDAIDRVMLHPVFGLALLAVIMFMIFQAVFSWAAPFMDGIESVFGYLGELLSAP